MIDVRIKSWKALAALVGVVALMASSATIVLANSYSDIPSGSFFEGPVDDITDAGCAGGFGDGTFRTGDPALRGQFALWAANCMSRTGRATNPNVTGLSISAWQTVDAPGIDIAGFPGEQQYLHVNAYFTFDAASTPCPCDLYMRAQLVDTSSGLVTETSEEIFRVVEEGSGGDIDDTFVGVFRFVVNTDNQYTVNVQGRVFGTTNTCTGNCMTMTDSATNLFTSPLDQFSAGVESGTEAGTTEEAGTNAVLAPNGNPNG